MAQLVEHILGKDEVIGSIPISSSKKLRTELFYFENIKEAVFTASFFVPASFVLGENKASTSLVF